MRPTWHPSPQTSLETNVTGVGAEWSHPAGVTECIYLPCSPFRAPPLFYVPEKKEGTGGGGGLLRGLLGWEITGFQGDRLDGKHSSSQMKGIKVVQSDGTGGSSPRIRTVFLKNKDLVSLFSFLFAKLGSFDVLSFCSFLFFFSLIREIKACGCWPKLRFVNRMDTLSLSLSPVLKTLHKATRGHRKEPLLTARLTKGPSEPGELRPAQRPNQCTTRARFTPSSFSESVMNGLQLHISLFNLECAFLWEDYIIIYIYHFLRV